MDNTSCLEYVLDGAALICFLPFIVVSIGFILACWKHDTYLEKHYPDMAPQMSVSVFGGNWSIFSNLKNIFSSEPALDSNIYKLRRSVKLWNIACWLLPILWAVVFVAVIFIGIVLNALGI